MLKLRKMLPFNTCGWLIEVATSGGLTVLHESWQLKKDLEWFLKTTHWDILREEIFVSHILQKVLLHAHEKNILCK